MIVRPVLGTVVQVRVPGAAVFGPGGRYEGGSCGTITKLGLNSAQ